jgi:hypothetical protein
MGVPLTASTITFATWLLDRAVLKFIPNKLLDLKFKNLNLYLSTYKYLGLCGMEVQVKKKLSFNNL